jgi:hypothetical protein
MNKPVLSVLGWIAYATGIAEVLHVLQLVLIVTMTGSVKIPLVMLNLLTVLMGLLLMLTGYIYRKNLSDQMLWAALAAFGHWLMTILYMVFYSSRLVSSVQFVQGYASLDYVAFWSMISGFSIWLGLTGLYQHFLPDDPDFIRASGRFRWIGLLIVLAIIFCGMILAGNPLAFIDPASLFIVTAPLPVLIWTSGLEGKKLIEFFGGILSLSIVQQQHTDAFANYAERSGRFVLYLGALGTLIGLVTLLNHLDEPSRFGPSVAVSMITLLYGIIAKTIVFEPYAEALKQSR